MRRRFQDSSGYRIQFLSAFREGMLHNETVKDREIIVGGDTSADHGDPEADVELHLVGLRQDGTTYLALH